MRIELLSTSSIEPELPDSSSARMPQHDPAWLDVLRDSGEAVDALLAIDGDALVGYLPFSVRDSAIGTVLSSQPYVAYGGPVARDDDADITAELFRAYRDLATQQGAVVAAIGTPPLLDEAVEARWREQFAPTFVTENFVQLTSLDRHPLEQISNDRRSTTRRQIRLAREAGCRIIRDVMPAQRAAWRAIYEERYRELGAVPYPARLHQAIFDHLAGKHELWLVEIDGEVIGGTLFLIDDLTVDYFATAYRTDHRNRFPQDFVLNEAFAHYAGRVLNWESSPRGGGVSEFKARWGGRPSRHFYYSLVIDESILARGAAEILAAFPLRFVVPFSELRS
jgi:hypothetical protein